VNDKSGVADQVISLPKGGGAIKGIGETFRPNLQTGMANFSVPINLPPGRNGAQPQLSLTYSSGAPNGPFGLGWSLGVPSIDRKTSRGIPRYQHDDTYALANEELVLVDSAQNVYRPRTEGPFARIEHNEGTAEGWEITTKGGLTSVYGDSSASRLHDDAHPERIFRWLLSKTRDVNGNLVVYRYKREDGAGLDGEWYEQNRSYNQVYLSQIDYANYPASGGERFMFSVEFDYGDYDQEGRPSAAWTYRPDPFSSYRSGFEIRTVRRCRRVLVKVREQNGPPAGTLIKSYRIRFLDELSEPERRGETLPLNAVSLLAEITVTGHRDEQGTASAKSFPPLAFRYTRFEPEKRRYESFTAPDGELPPRSLAASDLALIDLHGCGLPDVLESLPSSWRYWRNRGDCRLDRPHPMHRVPAGVRLADEGVQLADVEGTGAAALLVTRNPVAGYYPTNFDATWAQRSFQHYERVPSFDLEDPAVQLADMDGDGRIDVFQTSTRDLLIFRNRGRRGWSDPEHVPRSRLGALSGASFAAPEQRVRLAAMNGDLQDLVVFHDRLIQYVPNMGHGMWGPRVTMRNSPRLPRAYDPRRLFLADVDGDGYADLVYVEHDRVRYWINQGGNAWSDEHVVEGTPSVADPAAVRMADMKGTGTSGVLWTYDRDQSGGPGYKYLDLTGGAKPYLLNELDNRLGAVTRVVYSPSTRFYVDDLARGDPWRTHLPFPVHVVERVEVLDLVSRSKLVTSYAYHDGHWDGTEREFCGFGSVDAFDSETFEAHGSTLPGSFEPVPARHYSPPTRARTYFHVGEDVDYWDSGPDATRFRHLPPGLDATERREALRALRGAVLRTELYALDEGSAASDPVTVTEWRYGVELVARSAQPDAGADSPAAVFFPHPHESVIRRIDRGADPRTNRTVVLYDGLGNVTREISVGHPRTGAGAPDPLVLIVDTNYASTQVGGFQVRDKAAEARVTRPSPADRALIQAYADGDAGPDDEPDWAALGGSGTELVGRTRFYYDGAAYQGLPLGNVERGNLVRTEKLVLTPGILAAAYPSPPAGSYPRPPTALADMAAHHYSQDAAGLWAEIVRRKYDVQEGPGGSGYGLVVAFLDPNGNETRVDFDLPYRVFPVKTLQPLGLSNSVTLDYQALKPKLHLDPNGNETEFAYDPLGFLVAVAAKGKGEGDTLASPTLRFVNDVEGFALHGSPVSVRKFQRREHGAAPTVESREYFDGFGRSVQSKAEAEPEVSGGPRRWLASGWHAFNNKGWLVERYEPFFSAAAAYEPDAAHGERATTEYDSVGRTVRTINPDGSSRRVVYGGLTDPQAPDLVDPNPWEAFFYDENDSGAAVYGAGGTATARPASQIAALKISDHLDTPRRELYDAWGRRIESREDGGALGGGPRLLSTHYAYDAASQLAEITDPAGRLAIRQVFDLLGRRLRVESIDAGARTELYDAAGNLVEREDARGARSVTTYDALHRPIETRVRDSAADPSSLRERHTYDRRAGVTLAQARSSNTLGRCVRSYDGAGRIDYESYDFKGNLLRKVRRLVKDSVADVAWPAAGDGARNQLLSPGAGFTQTFAYDAVNRVTNVICPDGVAIEQAYGERGLLQAISIEGQPHVARIDYNARSQRTQVEFGNGVVTEYAYDPKTFRLATVRARRASGTVLQRLSYSYDLVGNILGVEDLTPTRVLNGRPYIANSRSYAYDPLYRLTLATGRERQGIDNFAPPDLTPALPAGTGDWQAYERRYAYDMVGNLESERSALPANPWTNTFTYAAGSNRLDHTRRTGGPSIAYSFDAAGNLIGRDGGWVYSWDYAGLLKGAENRPAGVPPTMEARYFHDGSGARAKAIVRRGNLVVTTAYIDKLFEESVERVGGVVTKRTRVKHMLGETTRFALLKDVPTGSLDLDAPVAYQHDDHLGGSHVVSGAGGAYLGQEEFYPFGLTSLGGYLGKRYRFAGRLRDEETGLYYYGARHYPPWAARWASCDPAGPADSTNLYQFARDNPVRLVDPDGRQSQPASATSGGAPAAATNVTFTEAEVEQAGGKITGHLTPEMQQHLDAWNKQEDALKRLKAMIERDVAAELKPEPGLTEYDRTDPSHEAKVLMVIDYGLLAATHAATNKYTGEIEATRLDQLLRARSIVTHELRQSPTIPRGSESIILRDAEYYLLSRGYIQDVVVGSNIAQYVDVPEPARAYAGPIVAHKGYSAVKFFRSLLGTEEGLQATPAPLSRPGGADWVAYGAADYLAKDRGQLSSMTPPPLAVKPPVHQEGFFEGYYSPW
jgi:RHS repeat-associated protein